MLTFIGIIFVFNGIVFYFSITQYYKGYDKLPSKNFNAFILSDSHGLAIGNNSEKYNVYNFSAGSDSYFDIKRKIVFLLENEYNVNKIYLTVDDHTLSPYREKINNLDRSSIYIPLKEYINWYEFLKEKYIKYYLPILQPKVSQLFRTYLKAQFKNIYQKRNKESIKKSWNNMSEKERIIAAKKRIKNQFPSEIKSKKLENSLFEIISLCQANKIILIGIKFPLPNSYIKELGKKSYGADELFISKGFKVIDKKEVFQNDSEFFANQDHLNNQGGEIFSRLVFGQ